MTYCVICVRPVRRRWWERWLWSPFPLCAKPDEYSCRNVALADRTRARAVSMGGASR